MAAFMKRSLWSGSGLAGLSEIGSKPNGSGWPIAVCPLRADEETKQTFPFSRNAGIRVALQPCLRELVRAPRRFMKVSRDCLQATGPTPGLQACSGRPYTTPS